MQCHKTLPSLVTSFVLTVLATAFSRTCPLPVNNVSHMPLYISSVKKETTNSPMY